MVTVYIKFITFAFCMVCIALAGYLRDLRANFEGNKTK